MSSNKDDFILLRLSSSPGLEHRPTISTSRAALPKLSLKPRPSSSLDWDFTNCGYTEPVKSAQSEFIACDKDAPLPLLTPILVEPVYCIRPECLDQAPPPSSFFTPTKASPIENTKPLNILHRYATKKRKDKYPNDCSSISKKRKGKEENYVHDDTSQCYFLPIHTDIKSIPNVYFPSVDKVIPQKAKPLKTQKPKCWIMRNMEKTLSIKNLE